LKNISAQLIDDASGLTLAAASSLDKDLRAKVPNGGNREAAKLVGESIAQKSLAKGIDEVAFDRGGYLYHGRVKELATGARDAGLRF
jgi:large subunit ribosomal protein L18